MPQGASRAAHPTHHSEVGFGNAKIDMSEAKHDGSTLRSLLGAKGAKEKAGTESVHVLGWMDVVVVPS